MKQLRTREEVTVRYEKYTFEGSPFLYWMRIWQQARPHVVPGCLGHPQGWCGVMGDFTFLGISFFGRPLLLLDCPSWCHLSGEDSQSGWSVVTRMGLEQACDLSRIHQSLFLGLLYVWIQSCWGHDGILSWLQRGSYLEEEKMRLL